MDSLEDILNRVLQGSADRISRNTSGSVSSPGRRPLRDPATDSAGFFQDVSAAVSNIRSSASTHAIVSQVNGGLQNDPFADGAIDDGSSAGGSSSSAGSGSRTLRDDTQAMSDLSSATVGIARNIATAGKAIGEFTSSAGNFTKSVTGMSGAAETAGKAVKPTEGFQSWIRSMIDWRKSGAAQASSSSADPAIGGDSSSSGSGASGKQSFNNWLIPSSLEDGIRGFVGSVGAKVSGQDSRPSDQSGDQQEQDATFTTRMSQAIDNLMARSMVLFRSMSFRRNPVAASEADDEQRSQQGGQQDPHSQNSLLRNTARARLANKIGRVGRGILAKHFRGRVNRGMRGMNRAAGAGGGAGGAGSPPTTGGIGGWFRGFGRGAAGGGGGGGAAAGGAAAGGGAVLPIAIAAVAFVGLAAAVVMATKGIINMADSLAQQALRVAQWDGALSAAKAQLEVGRLLRDVGTAQALSESGAKLIGHVNKLEAIFRPISDGALVIGMEALNAVLPYIVLALQKMVGALAMAINGLDLFANWFGLDIDDEIAKRLERVAAGQAADQAVNVAQAGFHDMFRNRPIQPPRQPLPPIGGP